MDEFVIFIGGQRLENFTDARLRRSKDELTGTLEISLFMAYMPGSPVLVNVFPSAEVLVYVGDEIAFTGSVDRRRGTGDKHGNANTKDADPSSNAQGGMTRSVNIGPDEYTVKITCRGKVKAAVDGSHTHPTTNIVGQPTTQDAVNALVENTDIEVDWIAEAQTLDKVRFRDGATIAEELGRIGSENAHFIYETRDGKLRVTDDTGHTTGDPLILGQNILTFSAEQSEDESRGEIKVKGQRTPKDKWGRDAIENIEKTVTDSSSTNKAPVVLQHYGDGTPEALERRANFEANKRVSASKTVTIECFGVAGQTAPYDIGNEHYVEVPPEGIFDVMECTKLVYQVDATKTLKTTLTLSPMPTGGVGGGATGGIFGSLRDNILDLASYGAARRRAAGVTISTNGFPLPWSGAQLSISNPATSVFGAIKSAFDKIAKGKEKTPKTLPQSTRNDHT